MREIRTSSSMRGCRKRATAQRACALLYRSPCLATFPLKIQKAASARADSPQEMIFRLGTLERELWKL
jgi:hypothetical protein